MPASPTERAADRNVAAATVSSKRINFNLSPRAFAELEELSRQTGRSMTDVMRFGLGLVKVAIEEARQGHKLVITDSEGKPTKEIVIPQ